MEVDANINLSLTNGKHIDLDLGNFITDRSIGHIGRSQVVEVLRKEGRDLSYLLPTNTFVNGLDIDGSISIPIQEERFGDPMSSGTRMVESPRFLPVFNLINFVDQTPLFAPDVELNIPTLFSHLCLRNMEVGRLILRGDREVNVECINTYIHNMNEVLGNKKVEVLIKNPDDPT